MLKIRLQRVGRKHEPSFRLVLTESENSTKSGRFKEILGSYDPRHSGAGSRKSGGSLNAERIKYWISKGVSLTDTVHNLLVKNKIITAKKINVSAVSKKAPEIKSEPVKTTPEADVIVEEVSTPIETPVASAEEVKTEVEVEEQTV